MTSSLGNRPQKSALLVCIPIVCLIGIAVVCMGPMFQRLERLAQPMAMLAFISTAVWLLALWCWLHRLVFQFASLFTSRRDSRIPQSAAPQKIVLLYATCDDFQPVACESCFNQNYPENCYRVLICDDSRELESRSAIDLFVRRFPRVPKIVRREWQTGYKAGNLNNAIRNLSSDEDWIVIVDSDQTLPPDFLSRLSPILKVQPNHVAFVQCFHDSDHGIADKATRFQEALGMQVPLFYENDLPLRERFGFMPFLGHGGAVRRQAWDKLGGFPEVVSEDLAFSFKLRDHGYVGSYAESVRSFEAFPKDFGAFIVQLNKYAASTAELLRSSILSHLKPNACLVERLDILMMLFGYALVPFVVANAFLSAYVCSGLSPFGVWVLGPIIPYLFITLFFSNIPLLVSVTDQPRTVVRYWFWSAGICSASMPLIAFAFLRHIFRPAVFEPTPKGDKPSPRFCKASTVLVLLGILAIGLSIRWWSPFSPWLFGQGVAYLLFPLFLRLNAGGIAGSLARLSVWIPGICYLVALYTMWEWGRF